MSVYAMENPVRSMYAVSVARNRHTAMRCRGSGCKICASHSEVDCERAARFRSRCFALYLSLSNCQALVVLRETSSPPELDREPLMVVNQSQSPSLAQRASPTRPPRAIDETVTCITLRTNQRLTKSYKVLQTYVCLALVVAVLRLYRVVRRLSVRRFVLSLGSTLARVPTAVRSCGGARNRCVKKSEENDDETPGSSRRGHHVPPPPPLLLIHKPMIYSRRS